MGRLDGAAYSKTLPNAVQTNVGLAPELVELDLRGEQLIELRGELGRRERFREESRRPVFLQLNCRGKFPSANYQQR
jgi:hypothetical protein